MSSVEENVREEEIQEQIKHANKLLSLTPYMDGRPTQTGFWSGCNYTINRGNTDTEPVGSATSMHDCDFCEHLTYCTVKQANPVFRMTPEIDKELTDKLQATMEQAKRNKLN